MVHDLDERELEGEEGAVETTDDSAVQSLQGFGLLNYAFVYSERFSTPLDRVFDLQVDLVLAAVCYIVQRNRAEEERVKAWQKHH